MTADANKQKVKDYFANVLNKPKPDVNDIKSSLGAGYTFNGKAQDANEALAFVEGLHKSFPGLTLTIENILAEDDSVALRWCFEAPASGTRPSGKLRGTNIVDFDANGYAIKNVQNGGPTHPLQALDF